MVKQNYLWDTGALILYFGDHEKAKSLMVDVESGKTNGYLTNIVLAEFYYKIHESFGRKIAEYRILLLKDSKNKNVSIDFEDVTKIGRQKSKNRKLSMVDCVISVVAKRIKGIVITTDGGFGDIDGLKSLKLEY